MSRHNIEAIAQRASYLRSATSWTCRTVRSTQVDSFRATAAQHALAARRIVEHLAAQIARDAAAVERDPALSPVGRAAKVEALRDGLLGRLTNVAANGSASLATSRRLLEDDLLRQARAAAVATIDPDSARHLLDLLGRRSPAERAAAVHNAILLDADPALRAALEQAHPRVRSEYLGDAQIAGGTWDRLVGDLRIHATEEQAAQLDDLADIAEALDAARLVVESELGELGNAPIAETIRATFDALDAGTIAGQSSTPSDVAQLAREYSAALEPEHAT